MELNQITTADEIVEAIRTCDMETKTILNILALVKTDEMLPMFDSSGIELKSEHVEAIKLIMHEHKIFSGMEIAINVIVEVMNLLVEDKEIPEEYEVVAEKIRAVNSMERNKEKKLNFNTKIEIKDYLDMKRDKENRVEALLAHFLTCLYMNNQLPSGAKEFVKQFVNNS